MSEPGIYTDIGKGRCVIILHTGCQNGLVQGALTIFKSDAKSSDYHGYMNGLTFYKWVHEKLKDKLLPNSVVVWTTHLTTAFKLSRNRPLQGEMQNWLQRHNVEFPENITKPQLQILINNTQK